MSIETIRRLAADILGVGKNRIKMNPNEIQRVKESLTRGDVDTLIKDKIITLSEVRGRRKKTRRTRRGEGKRKGRRARVRKEDWMVQVRSQRAYLRALIKEGQLKKENKRVVYTKIKSGTFRSKTAMLTYLKENKMLSEKEAKKEVTNS